MKNVDDLSKLPPSLRATVLSVRMNVYGTVRAASYGGAQLDEWLKPEHGLKTLGRVVEDATPGIEDRRRAEQHQRVGGVDITAHRVRDGTAPTAEYERGAEERLAAPSTLDQQGSGHDETEQIGPRVLVLNNHPSRPWVGDHHQTAVVGHELALVDRLRYRGTGGHSMAMARKRLRIGAS